jgi:hypothetical protein
VGAIERGAFGFSNEKSFTYCASTPICGIAAWGAGPPFVADMLVSGPPAGAKAWLTQGKRVNNASNRERSAAAGDAPASGLLPKSCTSCPGNWPPRFRRFDTNGNGSFGYNVGATAVIV